MEENSEKGTYVIGYTLITINESRVYYDKPLVKGVLTKPDLAAVPEGYHLYTLDGGAYVKVVEDIPNGVLGWEGWSIMADLPAKTGYVHDDARQFIYKQCDYGKHYELYIPVRPK